MKLGFTGIYPRKIRGELMRITSCDPLDALGFNQEQWGSSWEFIDIL
jgi:hypothetical protein